MSVELDTRLDEAWATLTSPGAEFELRRVPSNGRDVLGYVNAPMSLAAIWSASVQYGERDYLVFEGERLTYAEAHRITDAVRCWLAGQGIARGDRIAIAMRNYPEWMLIYWACVSDGIVVVGMNAWWTSSEMAFGLNDSGAAVIFCDAERLERLPPASGLHRAVKVVAVRTEPSKGGLAWSEVMSSAGTIPEVDIQPDDDASILYTSGTTGVPKGARQTHLSSVTSFMNQRFSGEVQNLAVELAYGASATAGVPAIPVALATTPLFHVTANNTLAHPITFSGGKLVLMRKWDPDEALRLAAAEAVTHLTGVPLIVREFVETLRRSGRSLPSLYILGAGGAPFGPDLVEKIGSLKGHAVASAGYGLTEVTGSVCVISREFLRARPTSSGRALPAYEIKLEDPQTDDRGRTVGELCIRGGSVIKGYLNQPEATADTIVDGWLRTGDVAHVDEHGFVFIVDRKKDMILRGGENVYCVEVEAAFYRHPDVAEVCVFGIEDERLGEDVAAAVLPKVGVALDVENLRATAVQLLAAYKVPRRIWLLDEPLPRNASGKVLKRELRQRLEENRSA